MNRIFHCNVTKFIMENSKDASFRWLEAMEEIQEIQNVCREGMEVVGYREIVEGDDITIIETLFRNKTVDI